MKKIIFILISILMLTPAYALNVVTECLDFSKNSQGLYITVKILERAEFKSGFVLNVNDEIRGVIIKVSEAKRAKRNAYMIMYPQLIYREGIVFSIENENLEAKIIGYAKTDWKEKGLKAGVGAGLSLASRNVPGISQMFYFSKGFILPYENETRLRSAVKSVYENSPFAYIEKGEDLNIEKGDYLDLEFYHPDVPIYRYLKRTK